jgi:hypothetical protein
MSVSDVWEKIPRLAGLTQGPVGLGFPQVCTETLRPLQGSRERGMGRCIRRLLTFHLQEEPCSRSFTICPSDSPSEPAMSLRLAAAVAGISGLRAGMWSSQTAGMWICPHQRLRSPPAAGGGALAKNKFAARGTERGFASFHVNAGWRAPQPPNPSPIRRQTLALREPGSSFSVNGA